jgi:hypothetical protein
MQPRTGVIMPDKVVLCLLLLLPLDARCEWTVARQPDEYGTTGTMVAYSRNDEGYGLEIYRDGTDAIRSRFILPGKLLSFADGICPTYQIDRGSPVNRSINDALCLERGNWAEFILGHVDGDHIASLPLMSIMNGISIVFRFKLENGDYRTTEFSLQGSKRAMASVFGENISIGAR